MLLHELLCHLRPHSQHDKIEQQTHRLSVQACQVAGQQFLTAFGSTNKYLCQHCMACTGCYSAYSRRSADEVTAFVKGYIRQHEGAGAAIVQGSQLELVLRTGLHAIAQSLVQKPCAFSAPHASTARRRGAVKCNDMREPWW